VAGRPHTPQHRDTFPHRMFTDDELIKKKDIFDPIEDDDGIDWKYNPFDVDSVDGTEENNCCLRSPSKDLRNFRPLRSVGNP